MTNPIALFSEGDANGYPIIILDNLRVATTELSTFPCISSTWSSLPKWCQEAIQYAMNEVFKPHLASCQSLRKAHSSLVKHRQDGTFPQVVLSAVPGVKSLHQDNILSDETRSLLAQQIENATRQARSSILNTIIESKEQALKAHEIKSSTAYAISCCRDRLFDSLILMGKTFETMDARNLHEVTRALCHLHHQMADRLEVQAWNHAQLARKQHKSTSAADTVMDTTSDLTPAALSESIQKLIRKTVDSRVASLGGSLKKLSLGSGSRSRISGSTNHSRPSSASPKRNSSRSGKGSRPSVNGSPKGRPHKGAPSSRPHHQSQTGKNVRLAPAPTPFKQLRRG